MERKLTLKVMLAVAATATLSLMFVVKQRKDTMPNENGNAERIGTTSICVGDTDTERIPFESTNVENTDTKKVYTEGESLPTLEELAAESIASSKEEPEMTYGLRADGTFGATATNIVVRPKEIWIPSDSETAAEYVNIACETFWPNGTIPDYIILSRQVIIQGEKIRVSFTEHNPPPKKENPMWSSSFRMTRSSKTASPPCSTTTMTTPLVSERARRRSILTGIREGRFQCRVPVPDMSGFTAMGDIPISGISIRSTTVRR